MDNRVTDPQQELFTALLLGLREQGYDVYDGFLPPEMAADGIHLKAQYMDIWKQYLLSHAVVVTQ